MTYALEFSQFEATADRTALVMALRQAQQETRRIAADNLRLAQELGDTRAQLAESTSEIFWVKGLLANPQLNGNQARVLYAVYQLSSEGKKRADGLIRMFRGAIANRSGISPRTVTSTVKLLAESGNLQRAIEIRGGGDEDLLKELYLAIPRHVLEHPAGIEIGHDDESTWGGWRVKTCKSCGSPDLEEIHRHICKSCGQVHNHGETIDVLESTLQAQEEMDRYPLVMAEILAADGIYPPGDGAGHTRQCIRCGDRTWLPAYQNNVWIYLCGSALCHPLLMASYGLDLSTGSAYEGETKL